MVINQIDTLIINLTPQPPAPAGAPWVSLKGRGENKTFKCFAGLKAPQNTNSFNNLD